MANGIADYMAKFHTKFMRSFVPKKLERNEETGKIKVTFVKSDAQDLSEAQTEEFDTVLFAIGRTANTKNIGLDKAGLQVQENGKMIVDEREKTNVGHIFAIGDIQYGRLELTPSAIKAG